MWTPNQALTCFPCCLWMCPLCGCKVLSLQGEQEIQIFQVNLPMLKTLGRNSNFSKTCVGQTTYGWALEYKL